jgi:superfamily I DNA and/or RNA helicase
MSLLSSLFCFVGFFQDARRWNVSITRAKRALIVVGHKDTLATDPCIGDWLKFMMKRHLIVDADEVLATWK